MHLRNALVLAALLACLNPAQASAAAIIYDLNCYITSSGCTAGELYGTLTLVDVTYLGNDAVRLDVDLEGSGIHKIQEVTLNFDSGGSGAVPNATLSDGTSLSYSPNGISADGYQGDFDIQIPANGNLRLRAVQCHYLRRVGRRPFHELFHPDRADLLRRHRPVVCSCPHRQHQLLEQRDGGVRSRHRRIGIPLGGLHGGPYPAHRSSTATGSGAGQPCPPGVGIAVRCRTSQAAAALERALAAQGSARS